MARLQQGAQHTIVINLVKICKVQGTRPPGAQLRRPRVEAVYLTQRHLRLQHSAQTLHSGRPPAIYNAMQPIVPAYNKIKNNYVNIHRHAVAGRGSIFGWPSPSEETLNEANRHSQKAPPAADGTPLASASVRHTYVTSHHAIQVLWTSIRYNKIFSNDHTAYTH